MLPGIVGMARARLAWESDIGALSEELDDDSADIVNRGPGANDVDEMLHLGIVAAAKHVQQLIQEFSLAGQLLLCPSRGGLAASVGHFIEDTLPVMRNTLCTWDSSTLTKKRTKVRYALSIH